MGRTDTGRNASGADRPSRDAERSHPTFGVVPRSTRHRLFWAWAVANVVLTLLPVWDVAFNDGRIVGGFLPLTLLWSYAVFASNFLLAIAFYFVWARPWALAVDNRPVRESAEVAPPSGREREV